MTATQPASPYVRDNFGPVREEVTAFDLPVAGAIPRELDGRYLRNGPNPIAPVGPEYHWFVGDGMVHGIRLRDGKAEWYRNRFVRGPEVAKALGEPVPPSPYDPSVVIFAANTNVIGHAGRTFAIVEAGSPPIELTDELDTIGPTNFDGTLEHPFSAHPKRDPRTGELHVMAYWWGWGNTVRYIVVGADGRVRRNVDIEVQGGTMLHDIGLSDNHVIVMDQPCVFDLERAMAGSLLPYFWTDDYATRFGVLPRDGEARDIKWFDVETGYVFHPLNTFDRPDGSVVMDAIRHPRMFDRDQHGPSEGPTMLRRYVLDPSSGKATEEVLDDRSAELPRMNETLLGRENRYGYSMAFGAQGEHGNTYKYDLQTGTTQTLAHGEGRVSLEPVFVPRDGASAEDDGWIMQVVYDAARDSSDLVLTHAQELAAGPVAVVQLPQRVPFGFHGNWVPTGT
ncbi:MAG TPA: carotenoid oxygenase family protein [Acidimicrobiia bacterium]|nr:carotenoid oxygenase family protein [Acidimicrobiia bacterium]